MIQPASNNLGSFLTSGNYTYNLDQVDNKEADPLCMKTAIKAYKDRHFTGLSDEDVAEIKKRISAYLEEHPLETEEDVTAFRAFVEELYREFGFKGSLEDFLSMFGIVDAGNRVDMATYTKNRGNTYYPSIPIVFEEEEIQ